MMIEVISGKIFYKLETKLTDNYKEELTKFLDYRRVSAGELTKLDIDFKEHVGSTIEILHKDWSLAIRIHQDKVTLLFETNMDSDEFAKFIEGFFS